MHGRERYMVILGFVNHKQMVREANRRDKHPEIH